jgi:hypothetical protein
MEAAEMEESSSSLSSPPNGYLRSTGGISALFRDSKKRRQASRRYGVPGRFSSSRTTWRNTPWLERWEPMSDNDQIPPPKPPLSNQSTEEKILQRLHFLTPPVSKLVVDSPDPGKTMLFLELKKVCFLTTRTDSGREGEIMFVTVSGKRFYSSMSLADIERKLCLPYHQWRSDGSLPGGGEWELKDNEGLNPWFLRTHAAYMVNLERVTRFEKAAARTLWFEGVPDPIENVVSDLKRELFDERFFGI